MAEDKKIFSDIRRIHIKTKKLVNELFSGEYRSVFKGRGIEFNQVRNYVVGDDIKTIDWNVTARLGQLHVKEYVEERQLNLFLIMDISSSFFWGTVNKYKQAIAAEVGGLLALSAIKNNDKAGLLAFSDRVEKIIMPAKSLRHLLRIIREMFSFSPKENCSTNISLALNTANCILKRRSIVFLFSDFFSSNFEKQLALTQKRHDLIAVVIDDPCDYKLPASGLVVFKDLETGKDYLIDTQDKRIRKEYEKQALLRKQAREKMFNRLGIDYIQLRTDEDYVPVLSRFFAQRRRRKLHE